MHTSYWLSTAPPFQPPAPDLPAECDIAILGAGIMGSALANYLAFMGQPPLVIERNAQPAGGATGRNGGLVVGGPAGTYHATAARLGRETAREITQLTHRNRQLLTALLAAESIDAGYSVTGFVSLAASADEAAELQASAAALRADGFDHERVEWLDRAAAQDCLGTALGPRVLGGLFRPEEGVIHSARYRYRSPI